MKRIKIALIILIVLLATAVGIYFLADYFSDKDAAKSAEEAAKLIIFDFDENGSTKLDIQNESGNYIMNYKINDGWKMDGEIDFEANSNTAINICTAMASLTAERIIEDTDTAKYGFDNPIKLTVTAYGIDYTLYVGGVTPTNENYYVMKEGSDYIYTIDYSTGLILSANKNSLKSEYIADYLASEVDYFALWKGKESDENILFSMTKQADDTWHMDKPYNDDSVYNSDISAFIDNAIRDKVYSFGPENCTDADYKTYGFDNPQFVFEMSAGDKHTKVIFGDYTNNDTEMYGLFVDTKQVVTFYKDNVAILGYDTINMMNAAVYTPGIDTISKINVTMSDTDVELEIDEANEKYTVNGNEIDNNNDELYNDFLHFFSSFNNAVFESINKDDSPTGEAEVIINYTLTDGTVATIEYIPVPGEDSKTYWVVKDGEYTGFIVRKKVVANIAACYKDLEASLEK